MKKIILVIVLGLSSFSLSAQQTLTPNSKPLDSSTVLALEGKDQVATRETEVATRLEMEKFQQIQEVSHRDEVFRTGAAIFTLLVLMVFIVIMVRTYMDNRLRHKILENNVQPDSLHALLDLTPQDRKVSNLRWVFILGGIGLGLLFVAPMPLGLVSIAVMCLWLAASFLAFHYFVLRKN